METMLNNIRNETVSHQIFMRKAKLSKMEWLRNRIRTLKKEYIVNQDGILNLERELNLLSDLEMRAELEKFRHFDILNGEKMTPRFLALTKINKKIDTLDSIRKDDGTAFVTREERYRHIKDFYGSIYGGNPGIALEENCIENFLGPDVCNNNIVKFSKLSAADRQVFDNELTINELDNAAMGLNANSAGGMDGIGGKFIKNSGFILGNPYIDMQTTVLVPVP
jgi:hypothetical protein